MGRTIWEKNKKAAVHSSDISSFLRLPEPEASDPVVSSVMASTSVPGHHTSSCTGNGPPRSPLQPHHDINTPLKISGKRSLDYDGEQPSRNGHSGEMSYGEDVENAKPSGESLAFQSSPPHTTLDDEAMALNLNVEHSAMEHQASKKPRFNPLGEKRHPLPHEDSAWWYDMTRNKYMAYASTIVSPQTIAALSECIGRRHKLTQADVKAVHLSQQSVVIDDPKRGSHSLMEGDLDDPIASVDWTGFPVESGPSMFPPGVVTGKLVRLDKAGRHSRVLLDACPVPGVFDEKGDPHWPPEKTACLEELPDQMDILKKVPFHRAHGKGPDTGVQGALVVLGYRQCDTIPTPPNTDFTASVWTSSSADSPPLVQSKITHLCKAAMAKAGQGERLRAARTGDTSSAFLDMLIEDKTYDVQPRLLSLVENWYGDKDVGGGTSMEERLEAWSQRVYGQPYASLSDADKAIIMTSMEGALCYGRDEQEWVQLRGPCSILFEGTPSIVKVLNGPFDPQRAGKNIRQSDRGAQDWSDEAREKAGASDGTSRWSNAGNEAVRKGHAFGGEHRDASAAGSKRGKNLNLDNQQQVCTEEKHFHIIACEECKLVWQLHCSLRENSTGTLQVCNKPCHPDCSHGTGYNKSYVTRKPLVTRPTQIKGIVLVTTGRKIAGTVGVMQPEVAAEMGHRSGYTGVTRA